MHTAMSVHVYFQLPSIPEPLRWWTLCLSPMRLLSTDESSESKGGNRVHDESTVREYRECRECREYENADSERMHSVLEHRVHFGSWLRAVGSGYELLMVVKNCWY